jgi:hypothetical protein
MKSLGVIRVLGGLIQIRSAFVLIFVSAATALAQPASLSVDARIKSGGVRKLEGQHLLLYTDVPSSAEVDRLPAVFDAAVPQWAQYFGIDPAKLNGWKARAFLIADRRRFDALGLMPAGHDNFRNGISLGTDLWLHDQPTDYYRRHLLLHEGTHVFMASFLGGCGPGWYMEGMAELLGTHRLIDQQKQRAGPRAPSRSDGRAPVITLRIMPRSRQEVPMLGRIKLIQDAVAAGGPLGFDDVMKIDNRQQLGNESYAWCWAAAKFLDSHPRYRDRFRRLPKYVLEPQFNDRVRREFADDWPNIVAEWGSFVTTLDHGYDFERMAIDFQPAQSLPPGGRKVAIATDRGWQSTGVRLEAGKTYSLTATGRYQIAVESAGGAQQSWSCEPGGVSIEYNLGRPLGMLIGAIVADANGDKRAASAPPAPPSQPAPDSVLNVNCGLANDFAIGLSQTIRPTVSGTLYLRINDSAAHLNDNRGTLTVTITSANNAQP